MDQFTPTTAPDTALDTAPDGAFDDTLDTSLFPTVDQHGTAPATVEAAPFLIDPSLDADLLGDVDVWTPEIDRLVANVSKWVRMDSPGAAVYGPQRVGKTHACQFLFRALPALFGGTLRCIHLTVGDPPAKSEHAFLQRLMAQSGCRAYMHRDTEVLRGRLVEHFMELAVEAGSKRLVIIWDEAQNLQRSHYGWLISMFNELEHRRIRPFFLLVGQPELRDITKSFRAAGAQQVIGRFFSHGHEFLGVADDELKVVLRALESDEDDVASGPRRFLAKQYAQGFSLERLAEPLIQVMEMLRKKHTLAHGVRLPMQYLRSAVIHVLMQIMRGAIDHRCVSADAMLVCLEEAGFTTDIVLVYAELLSNR